MKSQTAQSGLQTSCSRISGCYDNGAKLQTSHSWGGHGLQIQAISAF